MIWLGTVKTLFTFMVLVNFSQSMALQDFNERKEQGKARNSQLDRGNHARQFRRNTLWYPAQSTNSNGNDTVEKTTPQNVPGQAKMVSQQDLDEPQMKYTTSSFISNESEEFELRKEEQNQSRIFICEPMHLDFAKAGNGRKLSGGEFVRGEWLYHYGLKIYGEGHDGMKNLHPMIFDSTHVDDNGLGDGRDVFALGSPNFDCGGPGVGMGGEEGKFGENCKDLGNILIPSRKSRSPDSTQNLRGRIYELSLGGILIFEFNKKTNVESIGFLNTGRSDQIMVIYNDGSYDKVELPNLGQNGFQNIHLDLENVKKLYINLHSFGAVTGLSLCVDDN